MKNKQGFTLAEMLIVLFIIGILTVFSISTMKRKDDEFGPLYYRAYEALRIANYNVLMDTYPKIQRAYPTKVSAVTDEFEEAGYLEKNPGGICQRLLEYINVSENAVNCDAQLINPSGDDTQFDGNLGAGGHLAFKGSNSQRFYFGMTGPGGAIAQTKLSLSPSETVNWFLVYVDLNGERGPNSTTVVGNKSPDIVAFALTSEGQIAPIGMPRVERKYLTAKVAYPDTYCTQEHAINYGCNPNAKDEDGNSLKIQKRFSNTMAYQEAVRRAWGCTLGTGDAACTDEKYGTYEIAAEADTIDFTDRAPVMTKIRNEYKTFTKSSATIDDNNETRKKKPASATADKLPGDCVANDPLGNPCKVIVEKYQK